MAEQGSIALAIVGVGKIVRDQHIAAIKGDGRFRIVATVSTSNATIDDAPCFPTLADALASGVAIDAVAVCTPPQVRHAIAAEAIRAGKAVFLEKPPAATLSQMAALVDDAADAGAVLFASWHSRMAAGVARAKDWAAERPLDQVEIVWKEDVRRWHPGQTWIWQPGGMGVFDPGINALSILTEVLPNPVRLDAATLDLPENCHTPIKATLTMAVDGVANGIAADFDFLQTGPQTWDLRMTAADGGTCVLSSGGEQLAIDGDPVEVGPNREYAGLYARFADLIAAGTSDADHRPLQIVADAMMVGEQRRVEPFIE